MAIFLSFNLAITFILELCAIVAFGYWGFQTGTNALWRVVLGIGAPAVVMVVWGTFLAPKASIPVEAIASGVMKFIIFGLAAAALYATGRHSLAYWLLGIFVVNYIINTAAGQ